MSREKVCEGLHMTSENHLVSTSFLLETTVNLHNKNKSFLDENPNYFDNLEALVEHTYIINGNQPVALVGHSLGGLYALYFLHLQDQVD